MDSRGLRRMPTFDPAWFPGIEAEPVEGNEDRRYPRSPSRRSAAGSFRRTSSTANPSIYAPRAPGRVSQRGPLWSGARDGAARRGEGSAGKATGISSAMTAAEKYPWNFAELFAQVPRREQAECRR